MIQETRKFRDERPNFSSSVGRDQQQQQTVLLTSKYYVKWPQWISNGHNLINIKHYGICEGGTDMPQESSDQFSWKYCSNEIQNQQVVVCTGILLHN